MSTITLDAADIAASADFLEQFLSDQVPDGDFSKGTAMRDIAVNAIAAVVALLRADATQIRQLQSLLKIQEAVTNDEEALRDGVTAILSNLLVTPKGGGKARGFVVGHASQSVDIFVPPNTRFTYSQGLVFVLDATDTLFVPQAELTPVVDADGSVLDYEFRIPVVAMDVGEQYNVEAGLFTAFDRFNPYVTRVDSVDKFTGGAGPETVEEVIARAPTAVSVRNLINNRSIPATLNDTFDGLEAVLVIGMGEPEMQRDIVPTVSPHLKFHVGGMVDMYLRTALVETSFTGVVGGSFARPDGVSAIFRDASESFASVVAGDIIHVTAGLPTVPAEFLVVENLGDALLISERTPFPVATDEASPPTTISYTIGNIAPAYSNVLSDSGVPLTTGVTSRTAGTSGRVTLPGGPVMDILDVAIINPASGEAAFRSTTDGFVHFPNHVNATPAQAATAAEGLQFQTVVHNPLYAQSTGQWLEIVVGTDTNISRFDGFQLRVRYRTLTSFASIDSFVRGTRDRVLCAYQLPRAHHPVVIGMDIVYRLKTSATATLDNLAIARTVSDYINAFDATDGAIDVSSIIELVKATYPTIANIVPATTSGPILTIAYELRAPTGDVLSYSTTDVVEVTSAKQVGGPTLALADYGVTDRTLRYVANTGTVTARQEGA